MEEYEAAAGGGGGELSHFPDHNLMASIGLAILSWCQ